MKSRFKLFVVLFSTCLAILILVGALAGREPSSEGAYRQMKVFTEVLHRVKSDYVEEPDLKSVTLGAVNGLLESIDPFASYLNAEQWRLYLKNKDGYKGDVGLVLAKRYGYLTVVSALPGSPAAKAGLTTGDLIESIKGVATRDMPLAYAEILLKGDPGTKLELTLLRMRNAEPHKTELTRAVVSVPAVSFRMLPDEIGYIRPHTLLAGKAKEIAAAISMLDKQGAKGLLLDLRQCAVGDSEEGIAVAGLFLEKGLVTYLQGQKQQRQDFLAESGKAVTRLPLVVTTNRGTADGAEITAAALLENKRAEVVGERTFGDAALRRPINMDDGGAIILSVAKYYSPSGKAIQDTGVIPSVPFVESEPFVEAEEEEETPEQAVKPESERRPEEDNLLKKAIEVLTKTGPRTAAAKSN
jgi:carboxyl-terminal processing protease